MSFFKKGKELSLKGRALLRKGPVLFKTGLERGKKEAALKRSEIACRVDTASSESVARPSAGWRRGSFYRLNRRKIMADDLRKQVGVILRFPIAVILGLIWFTCFWPFIAGIIIGLSILGLTLYPIIYPLAYTFVWLYSAFVNSNDEILPDYWDNYPDGYFKQIRDALLYGFRPLYRWTLKGFDKT